MLAKLVRLTNARRGAGAGYMAPQERDVLALIITTVLKVVVNGIDHGLNVAEADIPRPAALSQ